MLVNLGAVKMNAKHTAVMSESNIVGGTSSQSQPIESKCAGTMTAMIGVTTHQISAQSRNPVKCRVMATAGSFNQFRLTHGHNVCKSFIHNAAPELRDFWFI